MKLPGSDKANLESRFVHVALSENCRVTGRKEEGTLLKLAEELRSGAGGCAVHEVEDCNMSVHACNTSWNTRKVASHAMLAVIGKRSQHTLLNAVLIGLAVLLLLLGDTLGALVVVVLQRGALLGLHALCERC
jgi:hypothetical protein